MTRFVLVLALLFLWAPVVLLAGFAFSDARQPFLWGGFSLRWFHALAGNARLLEAAGLSLLIAAGAATLAVLAGGALGWVLARQGRFTGRPLFGALAAAPLVLPEVVSGLSLLLLFVVLEHLTGWPRGRGAGTVLLAHASLGAAYVAVLVQARLAALGRVLEEAAADLGAGPFTLFRTITLPLMLPSLAAGWGLAALLSLDDVVLASFTGGPGATTLPVLLFSQLRMGPTPEANALAALLLAVALPLGAVFWWWKGRSR
ncbi:ABC transporter permease subunit [Rhodovarius lipocyclicus]|uniref:ABC transporter permease subunit n=1 Tax=Rhodovarius lipocyclicus TaxID=268410 RepID=UPI00135CF56A|nr:ABC transporter permease subunit [Rhodovarius lipocyclicus]